MIKKKINKYLHFVLSNLKQSQTLDRIASESVTAKTIVDSFQKAKKNIQKPSEKERFYLLNEYRNELKKNNDQVSFDEIGSAQHFSVAEVSKKAGSPEIWTVLYYYLSLNNNIKNILEIGTNLGVSGQYFIAALEGKINSKFISIEGVKKLCEIAETHFSKISQQVEFEVKHGLYDDVLEEVCLSNTQFDLVFIDGNHNYEATIKYFEMLKNNYSKNAILIFDDIHWSPKMTKAWKEIIVDPTVLLSVDLFKLGILIVGADDSSNHNKHHQLFLSF
ncbi:MAG: O-methyltransferase [Flavobacteriales bacterium]